MSGSLKICVLGPKESGKTTLSNFLYNDEVNISQNYIKTEGVRILDIHQRYSEIQSTPLHINIWDCSGNSPKYQRVWNTFKKNCNGIVFVYNPENSTHGQAMDDYYRYFVENNKTNSPEILVVAYRKEGKINAATKLSNKFAKTQITSIDLNDRISINEFKEAFVYFLEKIVERK
ncbi:hypothetical protein SNEBB_004587 [Seison nebaliae]|nr:hypothetical protein SNEBB_004587 [Seison nebaliae]